MKQIHCITEVIRFLVCARISDTAHPLHNPISYTIQERTTRARFNSDIKQKFAKISTLINDLEEWFKLGEDVPQSRRVITAIHYNHGRSDKLTYDEIIDRMKMYVSELRINANSHVIHIHPSVDENSQTISSRESPLMLLDIDLILKEEMPDVPLIYRKTDIGDLIWSFANNRNDSKNNSHEFHSLSFMHGEGENSTVDNNTIVVVKNIEKDELTLTVWLVDSGTPVVIYRQTGAWQTWSDDGFVMTDAVLAKLVSACAHYLNDDRILTAKPVVFTLNQVESSDAILKAIDNTRFINVDIVEFPQGAAGAVNGRYVNYKVSNGELAIVGIRQATPAQATLLSEKLNVTGYSKKVNPLGGRDVIAQHYIPTVCVDTDKYICSVPFYVESVALTFVG